MSGAITSDGLLDPGLLRSFAAVAEVGSVSEAARVLGVVQPALSRQLQRLERQSGLELFDRSAGRLVLTPTGAAFREIAEQLLQQHRAAASAVRILAAGRLTEFSLASPGTTLIDVVIPFVATLGRDDPRARVAETQLDDSLIDAVRHHDLVVMPSAPHDDVASLPLAMLPVWAYVAPGHRWAPRADADGAVALTELAEEPLTLPARSFKARRVLDGAFEVAGLGPCAVTEANSGRVAQALVATGAGAAVVTEDPAFDLVPLRITTGDGPLSVTLHAAWRPDHYAAEQIAAMAARLQGFVRRRYLD
ncbi:DNA-binding transcriptional LysR family regulator [Micrococcus cohnii]|uniref:DNA-binding transcriptional LysR family regulator n=1 Tax=Micrococcus cohnii TaxID=993416 RepID=A0A7W7M2S6_9MICC|nr:LysR family transcriptional regulator [Micrococcus cohnii]MBB4735122.1 DNA-binding transcriptional LysR family regulator [Micrococcus cohnii]